MARQTRMNPRVLRMAALLFVGGISLIVLASWLENEGEPTPTVETVELPLPDLPDQDHTWIQVEMRSYEFNLPLLPEPTECSHPSINLGNLTDPPPLVEQTYPVRYWPHVVGPDDCYLPINIEVNDERITLSAPNQIIGVPKGILTISVGVPSMVGTSRGEHYYVPRHLAVQEVILEPLADLVKNQSEPLTFTFNYYTSR